MALSLVAPAGHDVATLRARLLTAFDRRVPDQKSGVALLLDRITTPNWVLEWDSPRWVGEQCRLSPDVINELTYANVAMLAYIRVADDIADGDLGLSSTPIAEAALDIWQSCYDPLFRRLGRSSHRAGIFRQYFRQYEREWNSATFSDAGTAMPEWACYDKTSFLRLAHRGATLKTTIAAACLLSDNDDLLSPLARITDHIMVGVALLDDAFDWASDLEAGRYNALIAFCSPLMQTTAHRHHNQLAVLRRIYGKVGVDAFFASLDSHLVSASNVIRPIGSRGFVDFIDFYRKESDNCRLWFRQQAETRRRDFLETGQDGRCP